MTTSIKMGDKSNAIVDNVIRDHTYGLASKVLH